MAFLQSLSRGRWTLKGGCNTTVRFINTLSHSSRGTPVCLTGIKPARSRFTQCVQRKHASTSYDVSSSNSEQRERMYEFHNGEKARNVFPETEFHSRIHKLRQYMSTHNIYASVFTSYHNVSYYSGFLYCAFGREYAYVVTHDTCKTVSAGIDAGQPWRRGYGDNMIYTDWHRDNFYHVLKSEIANSRQFGGNIGMEFDTVTLEQKEKLKDVLPRDARIVDIGFPTMEMRMMKSPAEVELIRNGAKIADIGGYAAVEAVDCGVPEHIVALHSTNTMVKKIAELYPQSDIMNTWTWFQSGINTDGAHNPVTTKAVERGDILSINTFPMIQGYYTALERTLFLDHVSDEHLRLWNINCEVHKRGIELIKPGARCCDIVEELNDIYRHYDLLKYRTFGYGHSFGVLCHYYGREAGLELREDSTRVLEPGMVISMEPMLTIPEGKPGSGGYREHDILVLKEDGTVEDISKFPFGPEHNIIRK